jgi:plastocyanin
MVNVGQVVVGIIVLLVVVGVLLYLFYSRTNAVEKTGFGSLTMLALVSLMIPIFWISESGNQVNAQNQQQALAIKRGMMLYAQVCTDKCYAIKDNKVADAKYNGYPVDTLNSQSDDELRRIISAGIYNGTPANANAVPRADQYGGQLQTNDVDYLFAFIRSADSAYAKKKGFTGDAAKSGFTLLPDYLQVSLPAQYKDAVSLGQTGAFGNPVDLTAQKAVTINIVTNSSSGLCAPEGCYDPVNVKVKVGTVITWVNKTPVNHTVTAIVGKETASPKPAPEIFDSGMNNLIPANGTFKYTVTAAAYNFNSDHTVIYYCRVHPMMLAELTIVQ